MSVVAVHCEKLRGGKHGEDPEEEAGPGGENVWLHRHRQVKILYRGRQSSVRAVDVLLHTVSESSPSPQMTSGHSSIFYYGNLFNPVHFLYSCQQQCSCDVALDL